MSESIEEIMARIEQEIALGYGYPINREDTVALLAKWRERRASSPN